jgi:hypothetical protein
MKRSLLPQLNRYKEMAEKWSTKSGIPLEEITTGAEAWRVAHSSGISADAYRDPHITDAHIKMVLSKLMPYAKFNDRYSY